MSQAHVFWAEPTGDDWASVAAELDRVFQVSRTAAQAEESFVYVVQNDDLLGRGTTGDAMVAAGLLSAARTAAIEGSRKGWTVNVIAIDSTTERSDVETLANTVLTSGAVAGELIHVGPGHLGKALA